MKYKTSLGVVLLSVAAFGHLLGADDVAPRMADSKDAQRIRSLTLIGGTTSPSSLAEITSKKKRLLKAISDALQTRVTAIDARRREAPQDDPDIDRLSAERDRLLKRKAEVDTMLMSLAAEAR